MPPKSKSADAPTTPVATNDALALGCVSGGGASLSRQLAPVLGSLTMSYRRWLLAGRTWAYRPVESTVDEPPVATSGSTAAGGGVRPPTTTDGGGRTRPLRGGRLGTFDFRAPLSSSSLLACVKVFVGFAAAGASKRKLARHGVEMASERTPDKKFWVLATGGGLELADRVSPDFNRSRGFHGGTFEAFPSSETSE